MRLFLFAAACAILPLHADGTGLTVARIYHPARGETFVEARTLTPQWRPDGTLLGERRDRSGFRTLERLGATPERLLEAERLRELLANAGAAPADVRAALALPFTWNPARDAFLVRAGGALYLVDAAGAQARRLAEGDSPAFSPDGAWVAYLDGQDIHAVELATGRISRITTGGGPTRLNGRMDWVYQEEVFNERGNWRAFWWSPDSRRIAFLSLDETNVPVFTLADDRTQPQTLQRLAYPKAGDPVPGVRLGVADLEGRIHWTEDPYPGREVFVARVGWDPRGRLVAHWTGRDQTWLECRRYEGPGPGRVLVREHHPRGWVEHLPLPHFLDDGRFLWLSSRTGNSHLYLYDGKAGVPLTSGPWDVKRLLGVDARTGQVHFEGTRRNPVGMDAFRVPLSGGAPELLTPAPGTHSLTWDPAFRRAVDRWSDIDTPSRDLLQAPGAPPKVLEASVATPAWTAEAKGKVVFQQVRTRDGFPMEAMLVLPVGFDPARKYPVFQYVYGGPNAPQVRNAWNRSMPWFQFLAQQGIAVWVCDNRSAAAKGNAAHRVKGNLGALELEDQLDGLAWLRSQGWADMDRVALDGYSYGGFLTAYALTHSAAWKLGVIGAPVTDWRLYDCYYTERYMGLPRDNAQGYDASSCIKAAAALKGKVMLIHGTLDTNVHLQNSVQFLDALQKAGHDAPVTLLPGSDHSPRAPQHVYAMYEATWRFLKANL